MNKYIAVLLLLFSGSAFALPITYICDYSTYSDERGNHKITDKFILTFIVDKDTDKSYLLGNNGSSEVYRFESDSQISFLEITGTLNIISTTIDSNMISVHSRNSVLSGDLIPSQYYGKCMLKR
jgi:hypothetical protein